MIAPTRVHALRLAANVVLFEAAWFAAILGGAHGQTWTGPTAAGVAVAVHLALFRARATREGIVILGTALLGVFVEGLLVRSGALTYAGTTPTQMLPPVWIITLWAGFGTLPSASLSWLEGRWFLQAALGAGLGPLTYYAGAQMGAASLGSPLAASLAILAGTWGVAMPGCFLISRAAARFPAAPTANQDQGRRG